MADGLEFSILEIGYGENDANYNFCGYSFGDRNQRERQGIWMKFPYFCVLIKHPSMGYLLYDVGPGLGDEKDRRSPDSHRINPAYIERHEFVDERLKQIGLSVNDINTIIISHGHWDHFGGLSLFKGSKALENIYMNEKDFAHGLVATHRNPEGYSDLAYIRANYEVENAKYHLITDDMELAPGIELVMFEGHTPGVIGLVLHCKSGSYIFPSDAVAASLNYGPPVIYPSMVYDSLGYGKAIEKLRKIEHKYQAKIIFSHDPWQFKTIKKSPFFYS